MIARRGFQRLDIAAAAAVIVIAAVLLLPGVQAARETTSEDVCANRLRMIGQAVDRYETVHQFYPDAWYHPNDANGSTAYGGWCTQLLPYLEQKPLAEKYRFDRSFWDDANQPVVRTRVAVFECPASTDDHHRRGLRGVGTPEEFPDREMAIGDYVILRGYIDDFASPPPVDNRVPGILMGMTDPGSRETAVNVRPRREMVADGLSNTIMIGERAGRPGMWVNREKVSETNTLFVHDGGWASYQSIWPRTFEADGQTISTTRVGPRAINCNNGFGVYAFHPGGANTLFGDGAVRFLNEKIDSYVFLALMSRQRGEVLQAGDY